MPWNMPVSERPRFGGTVTPPGSGSLHARRLLEQLALVQAVGPGEDPLPGLLSGEPVYRLVEAR